MDQLSIVFGALADPTRRAILARLADGQATVNQLAEPFPISLQAVSKHLKVLEQAGLITRGRDAQWRPCTLEAGPLREISEWAEGYRRFWDERYDRLDTYLREMQHEDLRATKHEDLRATKHEDLRETKQEDLRATERENLRRKKKENLLRDGAGQPPRDEAGEPPRGGARERTVT